MAKPTGLVHRDMHNQMIADRDAEIARLRAELAAIADAMHGPTVQPLADRVRGYVEECAHLNEIIGALTMWSHEYGATLKPPGADTYGEGKRGQDRRVSAHVQERARRYAAPIP